MKSGQHPVRLGAEGKQSVRTQFGALIWRVSPKGKLQVLLVKSRQRNRWIIPKGWPIHGQTPVQAAATEAWEEAGVRGTVAPVCVGLYSYMKYLRDTEMPLPCVVALFPLKAKSLAKSYPEAEVRKRKWMSLQKAASKIDTPELAHIIAKFDPKRYGL